MLRYLFHIGLILFLHLPLRHLYAQTNTATISLQAFDGDSDAPLSGTTARLFSLPDSQFVAGMLTSEDGQASLKGISSGQYFLILSFYGYESHSQGILIGKLNQFYDLGKITLQPKENSLKTIEIEGRASNISPELGKKSFAMDEQISQSGGTVLDAMRGLPGITVDSEGKVYLRGSDKVAVVIDGKQSSLTGFGQQTGLANIPAANIERIEIINNPSSKYDASGMAGIINIIYKKEEQAGLKTELGFIFGMGEITERKASLPTEMGRFARNPKYQPSLNLNYSSNKLRASLRGELLRQKKLPNNEFNTRTYDDGRVIASQVPENRVQTQYILHVGLDWLIDNKNTLTFSALLDYETHVDTAQVPYIDLSSDVRKRYWHWSEKEATGFFNYRTTFKHQFRQPGHELETSLQYTRGSEDETYFLRDSSAIRQGLDTTHIIAIEHTGVFFVELHQATVQWQAGGRWQNSVKANPRYLRNRSG